MPKPGVFAWTGQWWRSTATALPVLEEHGKELAVGALAAAVVLGS